MLKVEVADERIGAVVFIVLIVLVIAQVGLQIYALVDLARRRPDQVAGGQRWIWALVIVLGEFIGAIAYLVAGRAQAAAEELLERDMRDAADRAADELYGRRDA